MRMQNILTSIISHDQTPYVKGRYIRESIMLISNILEYTEDNSMGRILFSADFEKAFDSIEHTFIFATLQSFGFGSQFIYWVRTIFQNAESCVLNNGNSTGYIPLERSKVILFLYTISFFVYKHFSFRYERMTILKELA